jgi:hypothetical protein
MYIIVAAAAGLGIWAWKRRGVMRSEQMTDSPRRGYRYTYDDVMDSK